MLCIPEGKRLHAVYCLLHVFADSTPELFGENSCICARIHASQVPLSPVAEGYQDGREVGQREFSGLFAETIVSIHIHDRTATFKEKEILLVYKPSLIFHSVAVCVCHPTGELFTHTAEACYLIKYPGSENTWASQWIWAYFSFFLLPIDLFARVDDFENGINFARWLRWPETRKNKSKRKKITDGK